MNWAGGEGLMESKDMGENNNQDLVKNERADAVKIPALIANRFIVISGGLGVRFSFGEQAVQGTKTAMHTSILMSLDDTKALLDILTQVVDSASKAENVSIENDGADD